MYNRNNNIDMIKRNMEDRKHIFHVNGKNVETVNEFRYLGRIINERNDDWDTTKYNMDKIRSIWGEVKMILKRDKASVKTMRCFYKGVVKSILI